MVFSLVYWAEYLTTYLWFKSILDVGKNYSIFAVINFVWGDVILRASFTLYRQPCYVRYTAW